MKSKLTNNPSQKTTKEVVSPIKRAMNKSPQVDETFLTNQHDNS